MKISVALILAALVASASALATEKMGRQTSPATKIQPGEMSRAAFVASAVGTAFMMPSFALAKKPDGTTEEASRSLEMAGNANACMDLCIYGCSAEGKSKQQCSKECYAKCKTAKGQQSCCTPDIDVGTERVGAGDKK